MAFPSTVRMPAQLIVQRAGRFACLGLVEARFRFWSEHGNVCSRSLCQPFLVFFGVSILCCAPEIRLAGFGRVSNAPDLYPIWPMWYDGPVLVCHRSKCAQCPCGQSLLGYPSLNRFRSFFFLWTRKPWCDLCVFIALSFFLSAPCNGPFLDVIARCLCFIPWSSCLVRST